LSTHHLQPLVNKTQLRFNSFLNDKLNSHPSYISLGNTPDYASKIRWEQCLVISVENQARIVTIRASIRCDAHMIHSMIQ